MELNIVLRRKKYAICFATTHQKECCCFFTFKKSWRGIATWEHYPSTRSICQMLTGASKLFLHLIHSTWSSILNMCLLSITGEEEGADTFPQPKIFCSWMNQWNTLSRPVRSGKTCLTVKAKNLMVVHHHKFSLARYEPTFDCKNLVLLLEFKKFLNLRIKAQVNFQINLWLKFKIYSKIIKKKRNKFRPSSMRRFLNKKKRLARWWRCWKL